MRNYIFLEQIDEGTTFKRSTVLGKFHLPTAEEAFSAKREFAINFFKEHYPDADINDFIKNDYSFQKEEQAVHFFQLRGPPRISHRISRKTPRMTEKTRNIAINPASPETISSNSIRPVPVIFCPISIAKVKTTMTVKV